ncbi:MAG: GDSL-type esterase/lipase family protein [Kineosporiaceae bacterium]
MTAPTEDRVRAAGPLAAVLPPAGRRLLRRAGLVLAAGTGVLVLSLLSIALVIAVWPTDEVEVLDVDVEIGAQQPGLGFGVAGPGELESFGQSVDLRAVEVVGPVRPYLGTTIQPYDLIRIATTPGAPEEAGNELVEAFVRWALLRTPAVLLTGLLLMVAAVATLSFVGALPPLHRESWRRYGAWAVTGTLAVGVVWGVSLASAAWGSQRLAEVESIEDVFDYDVLRTSPTPVGAPRDGVEVVVVGDSRAAVLGGPPVSGATPDDLACRRSRDSLAAQIETLLLTEQWRAQNLACLSATVEEGLLQPQSIEGREIPPQVGVLKSIRDPEVVVVSVGPNDVFWGPILGSCYVSSCNVSALSPTVDSLMADFRRSYDDLLADLAGLEAAPQVIVVGAYQPFAPGLTCEDTRLPDGGGALTEAEIASVEDWRSRLNAILADGADRRDFAYVDPVLVPLCVADTTGLGPDIWPLESDHRFHPTSVGVLKTATAVVDAIDPARFEEQAAEDAAEAEGAGEADPTDGQDGEEAEPGRAEESAEDEGAGPATPAEESTPAG